MIASINSASELTTQSPQVRANEGCKLIFTKSEDGIFPDGSQIIKVEYRVKEQKTEIAVCTAPQIGSIPFDPKRSRYAGVSVYSGIAFPSEGEQTSEVFLLWSPLWPHWIEPNRMGRVLEAWKEFMGQQGFADYISKLDGKRYKEKSLRWPKIDPNSLGELAIYLCNLNCRGPLNSEEILALFKRNNA